MATVNQMRAPSMATVADFRAWAKFISDAMALGGFTKTADTGQIADMNAITIPGATNTATGYEMWQSNDAGTRFYVKIEYGTGSTVATPAFWVTVGWATDGAGNITNPVAPQRRQLMTNTGGSATAYNCYASITTGRINVVMFAATTATQMALSFHVERTRSAAGAENTDEVLFIATTQSPIHAQVIPRTGAIPPVESGPTTALPNATNVIYGGNVGVGLIFGQKGGLTNISANLYAYTPGQFTVAGQYKVDTYGNADANFIAVGSYPGFPGGTWGMLMRWE